MTGSPLLRAAVLLRLAVRNVRRQARRSLLTASAMALGLGLLLFSRAIADGAHEEWITAGVRLASGHVAIQHREFLRSASLSDRLDSAALAAARAALRDPALAAEIRGVSTRLSVSGLASSASAAEPILVMGVEPANESTFSQLSAKRVAGRYLDGDDRLAVYLGDGLARRLGVEVGSRVVLTAQSTGGEMAQQLVRVVGTFHTGISEVDRGLVQIPLATARHWLGAPNAATTVAVLLRTSREAPRVERVLHAALADRPSVVVHDWRTVSPDLDSAVRIDDFGDYVFHGVLLTIVVIAILNAVLMSVLHRTREFGVLRALGLTARQTGAVVFGEGVLLTALSGAVGIVLGVGLSLLFLRRGLDLTWLMHDRMTVSGVVVSPILKPELRFAQIWQSVTLIAAMGVVASIYPARRAARIDVAEAMKFER